MVSLARWRDVAGGIAASSFVVGKLIYGSILQTAPRTQDAVHSIAVPFKSYTVYLSESQERWNDGPTMVAVSFAAVACVLTVIIWSRDR